jgi:hypothetical protein
MTTAIPQAIIHHRTLSAFTKSLRLEHGEDLVNDWEAQVKLWENDHKENAPTTFQSSVRNQNLRKSSNAMVLSETTFAEVKHQLTVEEHDKSVQGKIVVSFEGLSPAEFIATALDLEHAQ